MAFISSLSILKVLGGFGEIKLSKMADQDGRR